MATKLSEISTSWSLLQRAQAGPDADIARAELLQRYGLAAYRYLLAVLKDRDTADEMYQEFCVRFLQGGINRANPQKGRFRDYTKTILLNLIRERRRQLLRFFTPLPDNLPAAEDVLPDAEVERGLIESWKEQILENCWRLLQADETRSGTPHHTVLSLRAKQPELSGAALTQAVSSRLGRALTEEHVRQLLRRGRQRFANLVYEQVANSLSEPTPELVEEELADLGLLTYCKSAVAKHRPPPLV